MRTGIDRAARVTRKVNHPPLSSKLAKLSSGAPLATPEFAEDFSAP